MIRAALLTLAAALVAALAAAAPASALFLGIADQKPAMFTDPLFRQLDVRKARIVVPWDILRDGSQAVELDRWMATAHDAGVRPLVSFGHSRRTGMVRVLPGPKELRHEFLRLRHRYPYVTEWATWNEANHCSQPTCHRPELVARYFDTLRRACRSCTILGAEVLDQPNMVRWVRALERNAAVRPRVWGLHNYLDANRLRTSGTRALLAATRGQIWFTETGGIVRRRTKRKIGGFPESTRHAAVATRWVFRRLVPLSSRITRVYLYHWDPGGPDEIWDSALISPHGSPRPAYRVLRREALRITAARRERERRAAAGR